MLHRNARWQTSKLTNEQLGQLNEQLATAGGAASLAAVQNDIQTTISAHYSIGGVSGLCQRLRIKLKTAHRLHVKKSAELRRAVQR